MLIYLQYLYRPPKKERKFNRLRSTNYVTDIFQHFKQNVQGSALFLVEADIKAMQTSNQLRNSYVHHFPVARSSSAIVKTPKNIF